MGYVPLITDRIVEQIMEIRDSGAVNMFDIQGVQDEAYKKQFYELVVLLQENPREYSEFILTGKR